MIPEPHQQYLCPLPVHDKIPWEVPSLEKRAVEEGKAIAVFTDMPQYEIFAISASTLTWAGDTFLRGAGGSSMVSDLCHL